MGSGLNYYSHIAAWLSILSQMLQKRLYTFLSVPVFLILYSFTAVVVLLVLLFTYIRWKPVVYALMRFWAKSIFIFMGKRLRIKGKEHMVKGKKYILLANHSSLFDITAITAFFPGVCWFGHERLLKIPLFGKMLLMNDYIPMTLANIRNTRRMMEQLMEKSTTRTIAIFPEGTRTLNGKMNPFYRGFIYLLRATDTDILPVTLNGFFRLKPKNRFHINFGARLEVVIHPPMQNSRLTMLNDNEIIDKVRSVIETASRGE